VRRAVVSFLLVALALAGCTSDEPSAQPTPTPSPTVTTPSPTPTPAAPALAPLTGLPVGDPRILQRPALAIKIDNHTAARPQAALDRADIVYEEPVEGGITRFIAIYHSRDASSVGPVRSARLTDLQVLAEYGRPLLAFSGAARYVLRAVRKADLVSMPHGANGRLYRRVSGRAAPHNLFTSTAALWRAARSRHTSPPPVKFEYGDLFAPPPGPAAAASPGATPSPTPGRWSRGRHITVPFGGAWTAVWRFDLRLGKYVRFHASRPHRAANGNQISAANVLVLRVGTQRKSRAAAEHGTPELALIGSGQAILFRDGVAIVGRWTRSRNNAPTRFTDALGRPFQFNPGITWVEIVPTKIRARFR
jgi:hypothetical protein